MIKTISFYSVLENGFIGYRETYTDYGNVALCLQYYLDFLLEKIGLDSVVVSVMCDVETNTMTRSNAVGCYVIGNGRVISVSPNFSRMVREAYS